MFLGLIEVPLGGHRFDAQGRITLNGIIPPFLFSAKNDNWINPIGNYKNWPALTLRRWSWSFFVLQIKKQKGRPQNHEWKQPSERLFGNGGKRQRVFCRLSAWFPFTTDRCSKCPGTTPSACSTGTTSSCIKNTMNEAMKDYTSIPGEHYGGYIAVDELAKSAGTSLVKYNRKFNWLIIAEYLLIINSLYFIAPWQICLWHHSNTL